MGPELIFLVLIAVVLVFGFGVLLVSRSRVRREDRAAAVVLEERPGPPPDTGVEPVEPIPPQPQEPTAPEVATPPPAPKQEEPRQAR